MDEINNENPQNIDSKSETDQKLVSDRQSSWPDWRVELLKSLWASGMNLSQIATKLGLNRNQVIGKKWRLGLARTDTKHPETLAQRAARLKRRRDRERERRANKSSPVTPPTPMADIIALANKQHPEVIQSVGVEIEQLKWEGTHPTNCRAIITADTERPTLYCGLPVADGESWCIGHCRRFIAKYSPAQPRVRTSMSLAHSALIT